jgi:hypothetical protein
LGLEHGGGVTAEASEKAAAARGRNRSNFGPGGLDGEGEWGYKGTMKTKIFAALFGTFIIAVGCVHTVDNRTAPAWPLIGNDKLEGRYQRSVSQVYGASVEVMKRLGTVAREGVISPGTNEVKTIEGKVNGRRVWLRVEAVDPNVTSVTVQVRTSGGGLDIALTHEIEKQIAIGLAQ